MIDRDATHIIDNKLDYLLVYKDVDGNQASIGAFSNGNVPSLHAATNLVFSQSAREMLTAQSGREVAEIVARIGIALSLVTDLKNAASPEDKPYALGIINAAIPDLTSDT